MSGSRTIDILFTALLPGVVMAAVWPPFTILIGAATLYMAIHVFVILPLGVGGRNDDVQRLPEEERAAGGKEVSDEHG